MLGLNARGLVHHDQGDFTRAIAVLEESLDLCRSRDFPALIAPTSAILGYAYALDGRAAEGVPLLERSLQDTVPLVMVCFEALWSVWLGKSLLLANRLDEAAAAGRRALDLAVQRRERPQEAYAERLLGEMASHAEPEDLGVAEQHYNRAASLAEALGMRPLLAHCHFGLAELYQNASKQPESSAHLATAATIYRDLDMRYWLERATAVSGS